MTVSSFAVVVLQCIEKQLKKMKENVDSVLTEKDGLDSRLSQTKAQMVSVVKDIGTVRQRCNELTSESTSSAHEKTKMMELVAVAKKEAVVAAKMAAAATSAANMNVLVSPTSGRSKGVIPKSEFTMEQIETQVKVLKSRLACNVCNERDKQVILMRCRHMFCRQCVDKNIKVSVKCQFWGNLKSCFGQKLTLSPISLCDNRTEVENVQDVDKDLI